jgi:drug/metabolite transporter (DMT)-like permease
VSSPPSKTAGPGWFSSLISRVVPAILLGAPVAWAYWHFILTRVIDRPGGSNKRFVLYTALLGFLACSASCIPSATSHAGSMSDVLQGVFMALVVVGIVAYLIWTVAKLLNAPPPPPRDEDADDL